jgi:membrane protease YdiL (CAAX protease family)
MNISKLFEKTKEKEFTTFPATLETYAWYKPILIGIIAIIVSIALSFVALFAIRADPRSSTIMNLILSAVTMIIMIVAIYIGNRLIYKIPFSTQVAPVRKWNWGIYIKTFAISLIVYGIIMAFNFLFSGAKITNNLPISLFILCLILPIFQGFGEEFLCRGLLMQTLGAWFKIPIVAIVLQAVVFAVLHPYQLFSLIGVLCTGLVYGLITWYGQGLEASSAMHSVNNIAAFIAIGFGLQQGAGGNASDPIALLINVAVVVIPAIIVIILDKFNLMGFES